MAMSLNRVQLIGNLTRDPEVRQLPGGVSVATFSIATNFSWTDKATGKRNDKVEFHNCVAWRRLGEVCAQYLRKGSKVFAEGRLQTREWEGQDGVKRQRVEIVLDNMMMLDRKGDGATSGGSMGASMGSSMGESRAHGSLDASSSDDMSSMGGAPAAGGVDIEQQEVTIDDLPF